MARYLIYTDVMIDVSRRNTAAAIYVDSLTDVTISIITAHELIVGARNQRDGDGIDGLIRAYQLPPNRRHCIENGCTLVSKNRKHFQIIGD